MAFDPSKPFQLAGGAGVAEPPAFDPGKPFAAVTPAGAPPVAPDWTNLLAGTDQAKATMAPWQRDYFDTLTANGGVDEDAAGAIAQAYIGQMLPNVPRGALVGNWDAVKDAFAKTKLGIDRPGMSNTALMTHLSAYEKAKQVHLTQEFEAADPFGKMVIMGKLFSAHAGQDVSHDWDTANKPFVTLPEAPEMPDMPLLGNLNPAVVAGVWNAAKPLMEGVATPAGVGTIFLAGETRYSDVAKLALQGVSGVFTGLMAKGAIEQTPEAIAALSDPNLTNQQRTTAVLKPLMEGFAAILGGYHSIAELRGATGAAKTIAEVKGKTPDQAARVLRNEAVVTSDPALVPPLLATANALDAISEPGLKASVKDQADAEAAKGEGTTIPAAENQPPVAEGAKPAEETAGYGPLIKLYRAGDTNESGVKAYSSWSEHKPTAEAYLDNPGFGGKTLRVEEYPLRNILNVDTTNRAGMMALAKAIGLPEEAGLEWFDSGWRYPWEESKKVREALDSSGYDAIRYPDDFPEGALTVVPLKSKVAHAQTAPEAVPTPKEESAAPAPEPPPSPTKAEVKAATAPEAPAAPAAPKDSPLVSIKNAAVDAELEAMGEAPATHGERLTAQQALTDANALLERDPKAGERLVKELEKKPRAINGREDALLTIELNRAAIERDAADEALAAAGKSGDEKAVAAAVDRVAEAIDQFKRVGEASTRAGTENGQGLALRRIMMKRDYSLAAMERRLISDNAGKPLTPEITAKLKDLSTRLAAAEKAMETARKTRKAPPAGAARVAKTLEQYADAARERIKARLTEGRQASGLDPADLLDHAIVGADLLAKGIAKGADWTAAMVREFGERVRPHLDEILSRAEAFGDQMEIVGALERRRASLEASIKKLTKKLEDNDLSTDPKKVNRPAVEELEKLEQQKAELAAELTRRREEAAKIKELEEAIAEKSRKIAEGDLAAQGLPKNRPAVRVIEKLKQERDALNKDLAKARKNAGQPSDAELVAKRVEDINAQIAEKKAAIEKGVKAVREKMANRPELPEIEKAKQELEAVSKELTEANRPPPKTRSESEARLKDLGVEIARLERQMASGEIFPKGRRPKANSPEIAAAEEKLAQLKYERQNLRDSIQTPETPRTKEEARLAAFKSRAQKSIDTLTEKIAARDASPAEKAPPVELDAEANKLQAQRDTIRQEYESMRRMVQYENKSTAGKVAQNAANLYDAARLVMTSGEFSFILRQGKVGVLSHPVMAAKIIPDTLRALAANAEEAHALNLKVLNHPDAQAAIDSGLHLVDEGASLTKQEEILMGRWTGKIPIVGRFNQAATVFLNRLRFDWWQKMRQSSGGLDATQQAQVSMFINEATGRGMLPKGTEQAAVYLGRAMFAPRYLASRIELATGHALWGGDLTTRRLIATEYARTLVGLGIWYTGLEMTFAAMGQSPQIGTDSKSSDFGKVKIGNTRLDPLAGVAQLIVFGARTATGETTNTKGKTSPLSGPDVPYGGQRWSDVLWRFGRSKLHPVPGAIIDLFDGTDLSGQEADIGTEAAKFASPLTYMDIYQALEEQDLGPGVALSLLALLGEGLQTYSPKTGKKPAQKLTPMKDAPPADPTKRRASIESIERDPTTGRIIGVSVGVDEPSRDGRAKAIRGVTRDERGRITGVDMDPGEEAAPGRRRSVRLSNLTRHEKTGRIEGAAIDVS